MSNEAAASGGRGGALVSNASFLKSLSMKFLVASVLSMFALYSASLINAAFVGRYLGETGLAAISLVNPVSLLYYTVGAVIGIGGSLAASRTLGSGNYQEYRRIFTCSAELMLLAAAVMSLLGLALLDPLSSLLSGGGAERELVRSYLGFYLPGGACTLLAYIPLYFLKVDGRPKLSSALFFIAAILNVALTWLFVGPVCRLGIGGVSLAISISMGAAAALGFFVLGSGQSELRFVRGAMRREDVGTIAAAGIPNGLSNLLEAARILLINALLLRLALPYLLTSFTVVRSITDLLGSLMTGLSSALLPLFGVFYGERDYVHVRGIYRNAVRIGTMLFIPLTVLAMLLSGPESAIFGVTGGAALAEDRWALPLACLGTLPAYYNVLLSGYFAALKKNRLADLLIALRLFLCLLLITPALSRLLGSRGVWLSLSLAEYLTLAAFFVIRAVLRRRNRMLDRFLLDTSLEGGVDISFSVRSRVGDIVQASAQISDFCEENGISPKKSMLVSLAVEEILTVIITKCMDGDESRFIDIRVRRMDDEVMMRIRNTGRIFDPVRYYEDNKNDEAMADELLGLKMIITAAQLIEFRTTFGVNNLLVTF